MIAATSYLRLLTRRKVARIRDGADHMPRQMHRQVESPALSLVPAGTIATGPEVDADPDRTARSRMTRTTSVASTEDDDLLRRLREAGL